MRIALLAVAALSLIGACLGRGRRPAFTGTVEPVRWADLRFSYRAGCPVGPAELRTVSVSHWGFDGKPHVGRIVVAKRVAPSLVSVFRTLWRAKFPIRRLQPVSAYRGSDDASMAADNTSAFNCRFVGGTSRWSMHAFGEAIDVNPVENPYVRGSTVSPPAGRAYLDRSRERPGMAVSSTACSCAPSPLPAGNGGPPSATISTSPPQADERPAATTLGLRRPRRDRGALPRAAGGGADAARPRAGSARGLRRRRPPARRGRPRTIRVSASASTSSAAGCAARRATRRLRCRSSSARSRLQWTPGRTGSPATPRTWPRSRRPTATASSPGRTAGSSWRSGRRRPRTGRGRSSTTSAGSTSTPRSTSRRSTAFERALAIREQDPDNPAAIEHAREAVAEARKAMGR